ncbi:transcriptional regulator swi6 [Coemansia sp. RSA 1365]|nr:transcriptional regulator swi6 [Coemansia sp. RSA 1365]
MSEYDFANSVYAATYSGIHVYEMICRGIAVMRRRSDSWLNATQLLKVAGVEKGRRTKILEREVLTGVHEKIQGGYGKYQGTWVPFERGVQLCHQYAVFDYVRPILEHDPTESGTRPDKTPTKAEVRRYIKSTQKSVRRNASTLNPSAKRETSGGGAAAIKRFKGGLAQATSPLNSDALSGRHGGSLSHGMPSTPGFMRDDRAETSASRIASSATPFRQQLYSSPAVSHSVDVAGNLPSSAWRYRIGDEVPSSQTIAEPEAAAFGNDASLKHDRMLLMNIFLNEDAGFIPEWLACDDNAEAGLAITNGDDEATKINVDLVIDDQGHTAVHWAAALARIQVLDLLLLHGADARLLNYDGESALVRAVQVTNNYENQTFPDLLELLHDTIPLTDKYNRTVLHHIALASGSDGREKAARYYADCLLSWIVRLAGGYQVDAPEDVAGAALQPKDNIDSCQPGSAKSVSQGESTESLPTPTQSSSPNSKPVGQYKAPFSDTQNLSQATEQTERISGNVAVSPPATSAGFVPNADFAAFLNLQDVHGNTALNIAARAGDRPMIRLLLNAGASATAANRMGLCPLDFGVDQIAFSETESSNSAGNLLEDDGPSAPTDTTPLVPNINGHGASAIVSDTITSPSPSGRMRARSLLGATNTTNGAHIPQTPLRSAVRGANKNLLASLIASRDGASPMRDRGRARNGVVDDEPILTDDIWSPASAEQRMHKSVLKIQQLMSDLDSDFSGEMKNKQDHFEGIKQQLRATSIELAKARETIHKLHSKASQLSEIKLRVGYLEETLARETSAVREAIDSLPSNSKPRQDLEAMLESLLAAPDSTNAPTDRDTGIDLPRIPGNVFAKQADEDIGQLEQDPVRLREAVERLRIVNQIYARRDVILRERVAVLRKRADVSDRERQYRQIIASCCEITEADVDIWIDKLVSAVGSNELETNGEPQGFEKSLDHSRTASSEPSALANSRRVGPDGLTT